MCAWLVHRTVFCCLRTPRPTSGCTCSVGFVVENMSVAVLFTLTSKVPMCGQRTHERDKREGRKLTVGNSDLMESKQIFSHCESDLKSLGIFGKKVCSRACALTHAHVHESSCLLSLCCWRCRCCRRRRRCWSWSYCCSILFLPFLLLVCCQDTSKSAPLW